MRIVRGSICTNKKGSDCEFEFEVPDDCTPEEIEDEAREAAFENIDWWFEVVEE